MRRPVPRGDRNIRSTPTLIASKKGAGRPAFFVLSDGPKSSGSGSTLKFGFQTPETSEADRKRSGRRLEWRQRSHYPDRYFVWRSAFIVLADQALLVREHYQPSQI